jgi:hypothetical protein
VSRSNPCVDAPGTGLVSIPRPNGASASYLLIGVLVTSGAIWRMVQAHEVAVLPAIAGIAGIPAIRPR